MSIWGSFFYEVNNGLLWRFAIFDVGFGMRVFLYGSFMALLSSLMLNKRDTTHNHEDYRSIYKIQTYSLLGTIFVWCSFSFLQTANLFTTVDNRAVLFGAAANMWLALAASVVGAFAASAIAYRKIHVYDVIFASLSVKKFINHREQSCLVHQAMETSILLFH